MSKPSNDFWESIGFAILVIAIAHSCTHCDRNKAEIRKLEAEAAQIEKGAK